MATQIFEQICFTSCDRAAAGLTARRRFPLHPEPLVSKQETILVPELL